MAKKHRQVNLTNGDIAVFDSRIDLVEGLLENGKVKDTLYEKTDISNLVEKDGDKVLSTNDYSNEEKLKVETATSDIVDIKASIGDIDSILDNINGEVV